MPDTPFVSSDPNAWMRPYWAELHRQSSFFSNLAPELQSEQLARAIEVDHPAKAQEIREWNPATRRAFIAVLDEALKARHAARTTELWRMRKGSREVQCVAVYTVVGLDLRLLERGEILRTELFPDGFLLQARANQWHRALVATGWSRPTEPQ